MEEIVKALLEQNAKLTEHIVELSRVIAEERSYQPADPPPPIEARQFPLYVTETEEDARAKFEAGEITAEQLSEVLQEIEFFNSDITIPTA